MKLIKKEYVEYNGDVYNLHVKNDHNYIVDGNVVVKNCHGGSAVEMTKIIDKMAHSNFRIGLTGTLDGSELHELEMIGRFGRLFRVVTTNELMERGDLAKLKVNFLKLIYNNEEKAYLSRHKGRTFDYQEEIDFILSNQKRNDLLIKMALNQKHNTLMLFYYVEKHGKILQEMLAKNAVKNLKKVNIIYQKVDGSDREMIRKLMDGDRPCWYDIYFDFRSNDIKGAKAISESEELAKKKASFLRLEKNTMVKLENGEMKSVNKLNKFDKLDKNWLYTLIRSHTVEENKNYNIYVENIDDSDIVDYLTNDINPYIIKVDKQIGAYILNASYQTLAVGVNIKKLQTLIFAHPLKAKIKTLQSIGRILRLSEDKDGVKLIDIVDDLSIEKGKTKKVKVLNHAMKHFDERLRIYESENFDYSISKYVL